MRQRVEGPFEIEDRKRDLNVSFTSGGNHHSGMRELAQNESEESLDLRWNWRWGSRVGKWERTTVRGGVPCEWMANLTWFKPEERIVTWGGITTRDRRALSTGGVYGGIFSSDKYTVKLKIASTWGGGNGHRFEVEPTECSRMLKF